MSSGGQLSSKDIDRLVMDSSGVPASRLSGESTTAAQTRILEQCFWRTTMQVRIQIRRPKSRSKRIRRKFVKEENNWRWVDPNSPVALYWRKQHFHISNRLKKAMDDYLDGRAMDLLFARPGKGQKDE